MRDSSPAPAVGRGPDRRSRLRLAEVPAVVGRSDPRRRQRTGWPSRVTSSIRTSIGSSGGSASSVRARAGCAPTTPHRTRTRSSTACPASPHIRSHDPGRARRDVEHPDLGAARREAGAGIQRVRSGSPRPFLAVAARPDDAFAGRVLALGDTSATDGHESGATGGHGLDQAIRAPGYRLHGRPGPDPAHAAVAAGDFALAVGALGAGGADAGGARRRRLGTGSGAHLGSDMTSSTYPVPRLPLTDTMSTRASVSIPVVYATHPLSAETASGSLEREPDSISRPVPSETGLLAPTSRRQMSPSRTNTQPRSPSHAGSDRSAREPPHRSVTSPVATSTVRSDAAPCSSLKR